MSGKADYLELGDWTATCYECGRKFKASQLRRHWRGYYVCGPHWEPRHPQDFVRSVSDVMTPPWTQPQPQDTFAVFCTPSGVSAYADTAVADCAINEFVSPLFDPSVTS